MKRIVLVAALAAVLVVPAFSQVRVDLGFDVPMTVGTLSSSGVETSGEIGQFLREHWLPFPEASLYYQFKLGPLVLAPGVRMYTFILESVIWPNLMAEVQLGPVFVQGQLGGLFFAYFGLANKTDTGKVLMPDLSVWLGLGKQRRFRVGAGVLGLMASDLTTDAMLIIPYIGAKAAIVLKSGGE